MKPVLLKVLLALLVAAVAPVRTIGQTIGSREYTEADPLVYEDAWDLWPYVFLNEHGEPQGFNIDMLKLVLEELKIPYVVKLKPTSEALEDLREGRSDLMLRLAATFHHEYGHYGEEVVQMFTHSIVSPKSYPVKVKKFEDLATHRVMVHAGSLSHRMMVDNGWENNCEPIGDMKEAIQRVSSHEDGMILWNTLSLKWLMKKFRTDNLQITPIDIPHGEYKFYSNDTLLLHRLDSAYARLCATDRMQPILNKWFYPERVDSGIPVWVGYVAGIIGLLVFLLLYYILSLRIRERRISHLIAKHNRRLALILHTTKVWVWLYYVQRKVFVWMNADGEMDTRELTADEFGEWYTAETFGPLMEALRQIGRGEKEDDALELTANDGRKYLSALSVFRRSVRGVPTVIVGMMDDQTERLQTQQEAKDSMLRYQAIFSTSMVDMTYYDTRGILTNINQKACETFHCKREDILAEEVPFTYALEDDSLTVDTFQGSYTTHIIRTADNPNLSDSIEFRKNVYYEQQLVPLYDANNRFLGIFGSGRDVTEFVNSYHQLKHTVGKLMSAAMNVTEYINNINYALHVGGVRLVNYSPNSHLLTVYREMNVVQLKLTQSRCLSLVDEGSKRMATRLLNNMDLNSTDVLETDIKTILHTPDHEQLALHFHFVPIYNKEGEIESYFGLCRDVSREKAIEEGLELEKAKAQEVEAVKNVFLRNMSYEIRTPVSTVVGFAELFVEEHDPEDEDKFIDEIKSNANYLLKLVNDILFLSRLDAHMIEFNRTPIDFAFTFEGHCQMGWANSMKDGVKYIVENPYEHLVVGIDDSHVGYIIEQMVANAARFTATGYVRARYDYVGDRLMISIDDSGRGITEERQRTLFERFSVSAGENGTRLAFPICKELTEQMDGSIYINSASGQGTTVWIIIPCTATRIEKKLLMNVR